MGSALEYGFTASGVNADIILFGESSAVMGIDPRLAARSLGMKVINIPNSLGSLNVTGDMALSHYLRVNRRPKLIVFYLGAWHQLRARCALHGSL